MIYLFDIDGTLTYPRQPISEHFEDFFYNWMLRKKVYFVTGSDKKKVYEQLSYRIIKAASGVFSSMANEFYIPKFPDDELVYENKIELPRQLTSWLLQQVIYSNYPDKKNNNFEYRPGMLNFSVLGRSAEKEDRDLYETWDKKTGERNRIATYINRKFKDVEARVGGQISIDIQAKGKNKSQASQWIRQQYPDEKMHFFGDRCEPGGNDYDIVSDIIKNGDGSFTNVKNYNELVDKLKDLK